MKTTIEQAREHGLLDSEWERILEILGNVQIFLNGEKIACVPKSQSVSKPKYLEETQKFSMDDYPEPSDFDDILRKILSELSIRTRKKPAIVKIENTKQKFKMSTDGNGRYVYLNPRLGGQIAVAEAARNVVCSGGEPLAITNCLNFGNPCDPEIYFQFKEAVLGIGDACRAFGTPVTGGNVSFYNESPESAVYPTPVVGMVGLLDDVSNATTSFFKDEDDFILTIGAIQEDFTASQYLKTIHGKVQGDAPRINLDYEKSVQDAVLQAIRQGLINSAHDISDGGLAINLVESCIGGKIGAKITTSPAVRWDALLFGETQSVIVVTINEENLLPLQKICNENDVPLHTIGRVGGKALKIANKINISIEELEEIYESTLPKYFK